MSRRLIGLALILLLSGCATTRSFQGGCRGVYSGMKYYTESYPWLPLDGKIFYTLDLPLTAVADTLLIPYTAFADPKQPSTGYLRGCKWRKER